MSLPPQAEADLEHLLGTIRAATEAADFEQAARLSQAELQRGFAHPTLFKARADWLERTGRFAGALNDLKQAGVLSPDDMEVFLGMARCQTALGRPAEAAAACDAAIAIDPRSGDAHYRKGFALELLGEIAQAKASYEASAGYDPASPDPPARLGDLAARRGDWVAARTYSDRALAIDPGHAIAILTQARADVAAGLPAQAERRVLPLIVAPGISPQERASAFSLLGDLRNRQNRTPEAFDAYQAANEELRAAFAPRFTGPGTQAPNAFISRLHRDFGALPFGTSPGDKKSDSHKCPAAGHVFVLGFPRSGTTLLGQILAGHPGIVTLEEKTLLAGPANSLLANPAGLHRLLQAESSEFDSYRADYWARVCGFANDTADKIIVDQNPLNSIRLPLLARLFPNAKILFAVRDPRDVVFSCFRRMFAMSPYTYQFLGLNNAAELYADVMRLAELYRARVPLDLMEARHERVVTDLGSEGRAICAFLGVDWDAAMQDFGERAKLRPVSTASATQMTRGLNADGINQWRRYEAQMAPVLPLLEPWVKRFGYSAT